MTQSDASSAHLRLLVALERGQRGPSRGGVLLPAACPSVTLDSGWRLSPKPRPGWWLHLYRRGCLERQAENGVTSPPCSLPLAHMWPLCLSRSVRVSKGLSWLSLSHVLSTQLPPESLAPGSLPPSPGL